MSAQVANTTIQTNNPPVTLVGAIRQFFYENKPSAQFMQEYKKLTEQDKQDFTKIFTDMGINIIRNGTAPNLSQSPLMLPNPDKDGPNYTADEPQPKIDTGYKVGEEHPVAKVAA